MSEQATTEQVAGVTMTGTPEARAKLFGKMAQVLASVTRVKETGYNAFHKYAYATEADLMDELRPALAKAGIAVFFSVAGIERVDAPKQGSDPLTRVHLIATFCCSETGATFVVSWYGDGQDPADKGVYKAYTGAVKYLLMKTFLVSTGDDPEYDDDHAAQHGQRESRPAAAARPAAQPAAPARPPAQPVPPPAQATAQQPAAQGQRFVCEICEGTIFGGVTPDGRKLNARDFAAYTKSVHGKQICGNCDRLETIERERRAAQ